MKCICGFLTPEQGRIKLRGKNVDFSKNNIENIGIILETPGFLEQETALSNLWYLANKLELLNKDDLKDESHLYDTKDIDIEAIKNSENSFDDVEISSSAANGGG